MGKVHDSCAASQGLPAMSSFWGMAEMLNMDAANSASAGKDVYFIFRRGEKQARESRECQK